MVKGMNRRNSTPATSCGPPGTNPPDLRERLLICLALLRVPLTARQLDAVLTRAERDGFSYLEFVYALFVEQTQRGHRSLSIPDRPATSWAQPRFCPTPAVKAYFQ